MQLTSKDTDLLQEIKTLDTITLKTGRDGSGVPYLTSIFRLHKLLFNEVCSSCPNMIPAYINRIKNFKNLELMSKKSETKVASVFALAEGVLIPIAGTSKAYSNANITEETAVALLAANPNRRSLFTKVPDDLDSRIADYVKGLEVQAEEPFDIEKNIAALKTAGVDTKASTEKGVRAKIAELTTDQRSKFDEALQAETPEPSAGAGGSDTNTGKNLDELQFDLDKAQQDFDSLDEKATDADRATAQEAVTKAQDALIAAQPK